MPKYTNKCSICGKPILKSWTICAECSAKQEAAEEEIRVAKIRLIPELLWEKRRYEIAKDVVAGMYSKTTEGEYSNPDKIALLGVRAADALIKILRKDECTS